MSEKGKGGTYLLITFLAVIWGSSFILMKRGLVVYSPFQVGAIRMFCAFLCLFPFVWNNFRRVPRGKWKYIAASGLLANGIPAVLFPVAQMGITSSLAGMINTLTPVFTLVIGAMFFGMAVTRNRLTGLVLGLGGALLLIGARASSPVYGKVIFSLIVVLATICYAFSVNILRHRLHEVDSLSLSGFALMFVGPPAAIYLFSSDFLYRTAHVQGASMSLSAVVALGVLSTAVSTFLFNNLIKSAGALAASSVTYLIPIVAVLWGFFDKEPFSAYYPFGLAMVLGGVYLINKR
jgi:drug/metabolite transporter (DMT)-like permease